MPSAPKTGSSTIFGTALMMEVSVLLLVLVLPPASVTETTTGKVPSPSAFRSPGCRVILNAPVPSVAPRKFFPPSETCTCVPAATPPTVPPITCVVSASAAFSKPSPSTEVRLITGWTRSSTAFAAALPTLPAASATVTLTAAVVPLSKPRTDGGTVTRKCPVASTTPLMVCVPTCTAMAVPAATLETVPLMV